MTSPHCTRRATATFLPDGSDALTKGAATAQAAIDRGTTALAQERGPKRNNKGTVQSGLLEGSASASLAGVDGPLQGTHELELAAGESIGSTAGESIGSTEVIFGPNTDIR